MYFVAARSSRVGCARWEEGTMNANEQCKHEDTRFHAIQRLGDQPPIELRLCLHCHTTISVPVSEPVSAAAAAASH